MFLGGSPVVLLLDVVHEMEGVGWVGLVGNDVGRDEHTDDEGRTDCVGLDLAFDVETEEGNRACDEDVCADAVKTHDGLGGLGCEAFVVEVLAVFGRVAVGKTSQGSEGQGIRSDQIEESQETVGTALLFGALVESAEIEEQVRDEEEDIDEASSNDTAEMLEDEKTKGFSNGAKSSSFLQVMQNSVIAKTEAN